MGLERCCMPAWVRFWQGARLCWMLPSTKNMVILCYLWKAISLLFMPEEFRCRAQGSMEKWEAAQTTRNGPSELAVDSARLLFVVCVVLAGSIDQAIPRRSPSTFCVPFWCRNTDG